MKKTNSNSMKRVLLLAKEKTEEVEDLASILNYTKSCYRTFIQTIFAESTIPTSPTSPSHGGAYTEHVQTLISIGNRHKKLKYGYCQELLTKLKLHK